MNISKGDYVIAMPQGMGDAQFVKRAFMLKVGSLHKGIVGGVVEKNAHIQDGRQIIEISAKDVVLNLGDSPKGGKVYGVDVTNRHFGNKIHEKFGQLAFFYKPETDVGKQILHAFDRAYKVLKHNRLDFLVRPDVSVWEIMPYNSEKYAGMYIKPRTEKAPHRFQIRPEIMPATDWPYVIYHELAHYGHLNLVTSDKLQARWIKLYNTSINLVDVDRDQCKSFLKSLVDGEERPSDYKSSLDEEQTLAWKGVIKTIKQNHNITIKELDQLFVAGERDEIKALWPSRVHVKDLQPVISEYATKNVRETVAEAISLHLCKKILPKNVIKLVEDTLSHMRTNAERT